MIESIIFDLDGTLWDAREQLSNAWNKALEDYPEIDCHITADVLTGLMGKTMEQIAKELFPNVDEKKRNEIIDRCGESEVSYIGKVGGTLYEGVAEVLNTLSKSYRLFIVSNCQAGYVQAFLEAHKLGQYFKDIEMSGRTRLEKGDNIKLIIERNNISSSVYVGDAIGDMNAAKYAGIPFIFAEYGFGSVSQYEASISSILELPNTLANLGDIL